MCVTISHWTIFVKQRRFVLVTGHHTEELQTSGIDLGYKLGLFTFNSIPLLIHRQNVFSIFMLNLVYSRNYLYFFSFFGN